MAWPKKRIFLIKKKKFQKKKRKEKIISHSEQKHILDIMEKCGPFFSKYLFIWLCQVLVAALRIFHLPCSMRNL